MKSAPKLSRRDFGFKYFVSANGKIIAAFTNLSNAKNFMVSRTTINQGQGIYYSLLDDNGNVNNEANREIAYLAANARHPLPVSGNNE